MDKELLAAKIRNLAHMLDVKTKRRPDEKSLRGTVRVQKQLEIALNAWKKRDFPRNPTIKWAERILPSSKEWMEGKDPIFKESMGFSSSSDLWNVLKTRRSVRVWREIKIEKKSIRKVIDAARWAPSSCNRQTWRFIAVSQEELKLAIARAMNCHPMIEEAPLVILVAIDERAYFENEPFAPAMDAAAAAENMILAAHALGLGSCWIYWKTKDRNSYAKMKEMLGLPKYVEIYLAVVMGYPRERPITPPRTSISEILFLDDN
jgi:nitroreductase